VNVPVTLPPDIEQVEPAATRLAGVLVIGEQAAASLKLKPVPVTATDVPLGPEGGDTVITCGKTVSVVEACAVGTVVSLRATV
jgi:hypothetical protein